MTAGLEVPVELPAEVYTLAVDQHAAWLQGNRYAGSTGLFSPEATEARARLIARMSPYISQTARPVYMRPVPGAREGFVDLDQLDQTLDLIHTDGLMTSSPEHILQANPADCGEVAISGYSEIKGRTALALLHVNRVIAGAGSQRDALDYYFTKFGVEPSQANVRLSPSARKESYVFAAIDSAQQEAPEWQDYLSQDTTGSWHIDFHGKTVDDLVAAGIPKKRIQVSPVDTIASPDYFSNYRYNRTQDESQRGGNGLFFAIRVGQVGFAAA